MTSTSTYSWPRALLLATTLALPGLAAAQQQPKTAPSAALAAFTTKAQAQGLKSADLSDPVVTDSYTDASGLTHTYLQQRVNGLAVLNATGAVHTNAAGKAFAATQFFLPDAAQKAPAATPGLSPEQAVTAATVALGLPRPSNLQLVTAARPADGLVFNNGGISEENIPVRLMYERLNDQLVLVWVVTIASLDQQHVWYTRVDAQTGRFVAKQDFTVSEATTFRQHAATSLFRRQQALAFASAASPQQVAGPLQTTAARSLTVVAMPGENPVQNPRTVVPLSSANRIASPYGWQVGEGLAPSGFFADSYSLIVSSGGKQLTRGNNVNAYDDYGNAATTSTNGNLSTTSPDGGSTLNFDFPLVQTNGPRDANNLAAGITNLFYWNNINHDVQMAHGFDEVSGNFQYKNLTGTGLGNDFVRAEAQDGSGRNNANFSTPADGGNGRMQMYLFDNPTTNYLTITGAAAANGQYRFATVGFGPTLTRKPLAGKLVLVNDGVSTDGGAHGCYSPFVNGAAVSGNIAFIQRGGCPQLTTLNPRATNAFATKVKRAQANGATGVIVFDSLGTTTNLVSFGGTDTVGIRIPAIFISGADGFKLRAAMLAGATLNGSAALGPALADLDGSFDSGVMTHEFGHGVSNRLTGGPSVASCLNNATGNQTMGEGWSDFFGLWMTTKPGDIGSALRYVGTYDLAQTVAGGPGFRAQPYTTDMTKNTYTYAKLSTGPGQYTETHDVGEVWTTVLWDLNWQFIYKYGYNADFYSATGGNNVALKLVLDGCRIQRCNPGFLDGRDAILTADSLNNRGANSSLIWAVFARRGMGYSAVQGPRTGAGGAPLASGSVAAFDVPPKATPIVLSNTSGVVTSGALEAFPNPAQDLLTVRTQVSSTAPMQVTVLDLLGKTVVAPTTVPVATMQQHGVELNTSRLASGLYIVRVKTTDATYTTKVTIQH